MIPMWTQFSIYYALKPQNLRIVGHIRYVQRVLTDVFQNKMESNN